MQPELDKACSHITSMLIDLNVTRSGTQSCKLELLDPADEQKALARILHWLRNKKKDLNWCHKHSCYPGPKGYIVKGKGIWMPRPEEACLADVTPYKEHIGDKVANYGHGWQVDPYAWWRHCKSYEHCLYLVQDRLSHINCLIGIPPRIAYIASAIMLDCVPVLASSNDNFVREFFKDWSLGFVEKKVDHGKTYTRYQLLTEESPAPETNCL